MTVDELMNMSLADVNALIAELDEKVNAMNGDNATEENINEVNEAASQKRMLIKRKTELEEMEKRKKAAERVKEGAGQVVDKNGANPIEERAKTLINTGRMELRAALLSTGVLTPTAVKEEIGELPETMSTIVDDVHSFSLDGKAGAWAFAYRKTDSTAATVEEGEKINGAFGEFGKGEIQPETWGILDEISNQVKHFTPLAYEQSVRNNAYLALRRYAKRKITEAIIKNSKETDKKMVDEAGYKIDENFLRNLVLGFNADESVAGGTKLYLTKATLQKIGAIRGTSEKKPLYEITFADENNGTLKEGGMSVNFSILSDLDKDAGITELQEKNDVMIYGQMSAVDMPLWGNYTIETDEGGGYFARNMMGVRGIQTAGVGVTKLHAVQVINVNPS